MITGTSLRMASSGAMPKGSLTLGITYTSAMRKTRSTSRPRRKPVKSTRWPMPRWAASSIIRTAMSPEPTTTNFASGTFSSTRLAAAMKYSGPFCIVMRPRNSTMRSLLSIWSPACGWT